MHHASLLIGGKAQALAYVESLFGPLKGSPDYFSWEEPTFGIGEARRLSEQAARKAFGARKIFFLAPEVITLEAQNALLKTFEEPTAETLFFLVIQDEGVVIPTLRSRMQALRLGTSASHAEAEKFLSLGIKERLNWTKKFVDAEKNLSVFLDSLLALTRDPRVYDMRLVSDQRGASPRLVLEHLSVVL